MIRVAGYCRVSTDKEDQANSFESQQRYFREYIAARPDWQLHEIYADEGISGTGTEKRFQFNRMLSDAYEDRFQMILTKEVSRFSRNILDTIRYTRELKALGIGVYFLTDRISTLDPEAEMLLSFLASMAQEESRKTSSRVVWGQSRRMEQGVVFGRSLLGYEVKNGTLFFEPEGAELVRLIFRKYALERQSTGQIARFLAREGFVTARGAQWTPAAVGKILKNEKYVGDLVQKKTYTPDYLTHRKQRNTGQVPLIVIENHHAPIVSRELWDIAQQQLKANNRHVVSQTGRSVRYGFSGKIRCGQCGRHFTPHYKPRGDGSRVRRWCCPTRGCGIGRILREEDAGHMLFAALESLSLDADALIRHVTELSLDACLAGRGALLEAAGEFRREWEKTKRKKEALLDAYCSGDISKEELRAMGEHYDRQLITLESRMEEARRKHGLQPEEEGFRREIQTRAARLFHGEERSDVLPRLLVESLTVFPDRSVRLRLNGLNREFCFPG